MKRKLSKEKLKDLKVIGLWLVNLNRAGLIDKYEAVSRFERAINAVTIKPAKYFNDVNRSK